ncbi:MAG: FtsW/RodA/SpoVE family cell cycle protein [Flavobacteriales bacterium]|nr:FtsW/RodA/SpoVE family cell cycle protein [Flavobacteriales bacterium]
MKNPLKNINWNILSRGDKVIWAMMVLLLIVSLLGVISTGTIKEVNVWSVIIKYMRDILITIVVMYIAYLIPYDYYRKAAIWSIFIVIPLLLWAHFSGTKISGQDAGRWVKVLGFSFQPSGLALISMVMYTAVYMERYYMDKDSHKPWERWLLRLWLPIMAMFGLIVIHNLSTGIIFIATYYTLLFLAGFNWRQTCISILVLIAIAMSIWAAYKISPSTFEETRISTWVSRVDTFFADDEDEANAIPYSQMSEEQKREWRDKEDKRIQGEASQKAVALGVMAPAGPGKSTQKYFLSQADSDFIYAILVEEYGLAGGLAIIAFFIFILIRMILQTLRSVDMFSFLTLSGLLCMMMLQTIIHMSVVVGLIPVTGQNLPFISSGGTSVMMACLSVTIMQKIIARRMEITARQKAEAAAINSTDEVNDDEDIDNHMEESLYEDEDYAIDTLKKIQNQD